MDKHINIIKLVAIGILTAVMAGCGNSWEMTKKNWKSNYSELPRHVKVYDSLSKEILWEYDGEMYLSESSHTGNIAIIYRDSRGKMKKLDCLGQHICLIMNEK